MRSPSRESARRDDARMDLRPLVAGAADSEDPSDSGRQVLEHAHADALEMTFPATRSDVVAWFAERYPNVKPNSVRVHIVELTADDASRHHYAWLARREPGSRATLPAC